MKLTWDDTGSRLFETGVSKGVLYPVDSSGNYTKGVAWNGIISINVTPDGAEPTPVYANGIKITEDYSFLDVNGTIEAFTYPDEFADCFGFKAAASGMVFAMQKRKRFGLAWKTKLGNDIQDSNYGYKLHILYGCMAKPSELSYTTTTQNAEPIRYSWSISTIPVSGTDFTPTSYVEFNSAKIDSKKLNRLENALYGTKNSNPYLPLPNDLITIMTT